jgi:hypothetical protein
MFLLAGVVVLLWNFCCVELCTEEVLLAIGCQRIANGQQPNNELNIEVSDTTMQL